MTLLKKEILGLKVNNITKKEFLNEIFRLVKTKKKSYVVTPYSEFFLFAKKDREFKKIVNSADISIADGVGILIASKYQKMSGKYVPLLKCFSALLFNRDFFKSEIKEKLSGSEAIYYISKFAAEKGLSVFLLGGLDFGRGHTGDLAAKKLKKLYPKLKIAGVHHGSKNVLKATEKEEEEIVKAINKAKPDLLYIAYGPISQEKWVYRNKDKLKPLVSFCLGGSFDFVSGEKKRVPRKLTKLGLEGILRPFYSEKGDLKLIWRRMNRGWKGIIQYLRLLLDEKSKEQKSTLNH